MSPIATPEERARIQRQERNWHALPVVVGFVFLFALGFLLLSETTNPSGRTGAAPITTSQ